MDCLSLFFVFLFFCSVTLKLGKVRYTYNIFMSITVHLETCYEHLFWLGWVFLFVCNNLEFKIFRIFASIFLLFRSN